jgi:hypothetical protein
MLNSACLLCCNLYYLQGVIVLSRQWKNVLYTPLLLDHKYKSKHIKPLNVTFAVPDPDEVGTSCLLL